MPPAPVKTAIIGRSGHADYRLHAIHRSETAALVAAIDTKLMRTEDVAPSFIIHPMAFGVHMPAPPTVVWVSIDEQSIESAADQAESVVLCDPRLCNPERISSLLAQGRHVLSDYLPTTDPDTLGQLYDTANAHDVQLHIPCVSLLQGVPLTLRARLNSVSIKEIILDYERQGSEPDDLSSLIFRNIGALVHTLDLSGEVETVLDCAYAQRTLTATLRSIHGATIALHIKQGPFPDPLMDLMIEDHANSWRQMNEALYQGRSPQTILQGMRVYQDDIARMNRAIRAGSLLHPTSDQWIHILQVANRLAQAQVGPVQESSH